VSLIRGLAGPVARALRGRINRLLGRAATATGVALAFGAGSELAGIAITEYQLQSLIQDLPRAMDEMMRSIDENKGRLHDISTALLRTRIESLVARFTARVSELRQFRFVGNWMAGVLIMQQFSILITEVFKVLWDVTIQRMQRFALVDFSDQQYVRTGDMALENLLNEWRTMDPKTIAEINLREFINLQRDLTALSTFFDAIGRTSALGNWLGFSAIARTVTNISWAFGIGWLSWVAVGPGMRATIAAPLEKYYNRLLRQTDLPRETALRLWRKKLIDDGELADRLADLGYPDRDIELLKRDESEFFTESQIVDMLETGMVSVEEARALLERVGWREPELSTRLRLVTHVAKAKLRDRWVSRLESAYADGFVSLSDIENARKVNLDTVSLEQLMNFIVQHELEMELARMRVKTLQERFLDGTIDEDTLRSQLSEVVVVPQVLEAMVENLKARKEPRRVVEREEPLERRRRSLENRLETVLLQLRHQQSLLADALAVIDARAARIVADRDAAVARLEDLARARVEAAEAEFRAFETATAAEIEARIAELRTLADVRVREEVAELEARKAAIDEELETFRAATLFEIEERIAMLRRIAETQTGAVQERTLIRIDYLESIKELPVIRRELEAEARKRRLEADTDARIERIRESTEARIALLTEMANLSVEARRAALERLVERVRAETEARAREVRERAAARLEELEAERRRVESTYQARIEMLSLRADQLREELAVVEQAIARRMR